MLPAGEPPGAGCKNKKKMLSWLRCFPHEAAERKAKAGRSAAATSSLRKSKTTVSSSDDCCTKPPPRNRIIRTATTVIAHDDHRHSDAAAAEATSYNHSVLSSRVFSFRELAAATGSFRDANLIGEGGFGRVYRGRLDGGEAVAVKRLDRTGLQGDREFLVEVLVLSGLLSHPNLVGLLGYCADGNQRLLVYNLMPLGSLEGHLFREQLAGDGDGDSPPPPPPLPWRPRMRIAHGAARGLEFLHETASPPVIYRDLKSSNILLDEGYHPRLSDFGLARLAPTACDDNGGNEEEKNSSRVMGTYGYCAPEYVRTGHLTVKSDVYSFGVVLLELITGRRAIDGGRPEGEENLVEWAAPMFGEPRRFQELVDPVLVMRGEGPCGRDLKQALAVAAMCLQEEDTVRPIMSDVVMALSFLAADDDDDDDDDGDLARR